MEEYRGFININKVDYHFIFDNFVLRIFAGKDETLKLEHIISIINNGVLHLSNLLLPNNDIFVFVDKCKIGYIGSIGNEFHVYAMGFVSRNRYNDDFSLEKMPIDRCIKVESLLIRHPILDCFFSDDELLLHRCVMALAKHEPDLNIKLDIEEREIFDLSVNGKAYNFEFGVTVECDYYEKSMPYTLLNYIKINVDAIGLNELIKIVEIVKLFLSFISQSRTVNLEPILINIRQSFPYCDGKLYLRPDGNGAFSKSRVLRYEDIQLGISRIFEQILHNKICFRSLLNVEHDKIQLYDIINVCAAFESQFKSTNPKFKDNAQKAVRRKMYADLATHRKNYSCGEQTYFDKILKFLNTYNDILLQRLETALNEFVEIHGEFATKTTFKADYEVMPKRIKDARDALAHGNNAHKITEATLTDVLLLRAITYMLILQDAKIHRDNIKSCLLRMSLFAL